MGLPGPTKPNLGPRKQQHQSSGVARRQAQGTEGLLVSQATLPCPVVASQVSKEAQGRRGIREHPHHSGFPCSGCDGASAQKWRSMCPCVGGAPHGSVSLLVLCHMSMFLCQQVCHLHVGVCRHQAEPHSAWGQWEEGQGQAQASVTWGHFAIK